MERTDHKNYNYSGYEAIEAAERGFVTLYSKHSGNEISVSEAKMLAEQDPEYVVGRGSFVLVEKKPSMVTLPAGTKFYFIMKNAEPSTKFVVAQDIEVEAHVMNNDVNMYEYGGLLIFVDKADEICRK